MIITTNSAAASVNYTQYRVSGDSATFRGPLSTDVNEDHLQVKSVAPKRGNGQFGNRRSSVNMTASTNVVDLEGNPVVRNRKLAVEGSLPVGTLEADFINDCAKMASLLNDPVFVADLFLAGQIEY